MTWETEMTELLRIMINDLDDTAYRYTDVRLQKVIVGAAQMMLTEIGNRFITTFTTDISIPDITPDPCDRINGVRDDNFINLTLLKAGCFIDSSSARDAARKAGVSVKEWGTSLNIDNKGLFSSALAVMEKGWCKNYEEASLQYIMGNNSVCTAVLGPFRTIYNAGYFYGGGELVNRHWR